MLVLDHVGKTYPNGVNALQGFSSRIKIGEIVAVIGRNGGLIARGVSDRRDGRATIWFSSRSCHGYPHVDGVNARVLYVGSQEFGYRVEVTVPRQGDYTIRLTCGAYPAVNPG